MKCKGRKLLKTIAEDFLLTDEETFMNFSEFSETINKLSVNNAYPLVKQFDLTTLCNKST